MKTFIKLITLLLLVNSLSNANEEKKTLNTSGEQVFKTYCWGCHHQTSMAFGPSFQDIANKRTMGEIQGYIISPQSMYQQLGHKRTVMPSFADILSQSELNNITEFIMLQKGNK